MGMYDTVMFKCPQCGKELENQSKSGECSFEVHDASMVPVDVVSGLDNNVYCKDCKKSFVVVKPQFVNLWLGRRR